MKHTFKDAYSVLQQHAQTLRDQTEPNIDDLLTIVTESVAAYKVCQARIDAVERLWRRRWGVRRKVRLCWVRWTAVDRLAAIAARRVHESDSRRLPSSGHWA